MPALGGKERQADPCPARSSDDSCGSWSMNPAVDRRPRLSRDPPRHMPRDVRRHRGFERPMRRKDHLARPRPRAPASRTGHAPRDRSRRAPARVQPTAPASARRLRDLHLGEPAPGHEHREDHALPRAPPRPAPSRRLRPASPPRPPSRAAAACTAAASASSAAPAGRGSEGWPWATIRACLGHAREGDARRPRSRPPNVQAPTAQGIRPAI